MTAPAAHPIAAAPVHLRAKVAFIYFALLDHFWGDETIPALAMKLQSVMTNPGFFMGNGVVQSKPLQDCIDGFFTTTVKPRIDALKVELAGALTAEQREQKEFERTSYMRLKYLRFAVANLHDPANVLFAGNAGTDADPGTQSDGTVDKLRKEEASGEERRTETWETASTGKIPLLYAAHQLRFDLMVLAAKNPGWTTAQDLFDGARMEWEKSQAVKWSEVQKLKGADLDAVARVIRAAKPEVRLLSKDGAVVPLITRKGEEKNKWFDRALFLDSSGPPKLDEIFDVTNTAGAWSIEFKGQPSDADLSARQGHLKAAADTFAAPLPKKRGDGKDFTFFDVLWLMVDASHNAAATICIDKIGYLYINSVLWQTGLFDPMRNGGNWVGMDYVGGKWRPPPVSDPPRQTPDGDVIYNGETAASAVACMTLLQQGRLVNKQACKRMKIFLDRLTEAPKTSTTDRSPCGDEIRRKLNPSPPNQPPFPYNTVMKHLYAKIGLGGRNNVWDVALIERKSGAKTLLYAVAVLDSDFEAPLELITFGLDDCIDKTT
jgi:hypothetical protein